MYVDMKVSHCGCKLAAHEKIGALNFMRPNIVVNRNMDTLSIAPIENQKGFTIYLAVYAQNSRSERL
jgi:hypothetical protein